MYLPGSALEGGAVFECKGQAAIRVCRGVVQQAAPELFTEGGDLAVLLFQDAEEVLHRAAPVKNVADLLGDRVLLGLSLLELLAEGIEALFVLGLVLRHRGVLPDHLLDHSVQHFHLRKELLLLGLKPSGVEGLCHALLVGGDGGIPSSQQLVNRHREAIFHRGLVEVRRGTADFVFVLLVALPDGPFAFLRRVPDLGAIPSAAVAALDPAGEQVDTAVAILALGPSGQFPLDHLEGLRIDDGLVVVLHVVLRDLTLIGFHLLGQEVLAEGFLQQGISLVLLVPQYSGFDTMCAVGASVGANGCIVGAPMGAWVRRGCIRRCILEP